MQSETWAFAPIPGALSGGMDHSVDEKTLQLQKLEHFLVDRIDEI